MPKRSTMPYPFFTTFMMLAAGVILCGMGVATIQQMLLYQRLYECERFSLRYQDCARGSRS
jgi:hypothetical protein